ncbi:MAG TPA: methylmalonyl Co-A mutase-associated GTPase MeaB [Candidatus Thermoplasmatota archaeon]|nr:methylmalonyl Co-A mutase-associated GTPase MeaB [Candidatus Thermoplasmatota archaeon]
MELAERVLAGDRRAIGRAITLVESRGPDAPRLMASLYPRTGRAHTLGITGPPGSGKSTLVDRLIETYRKAGKTVGVVAVDPTSPFTGGALLGDRLRMSARQTDPDVFIRSMATRGHLGGVARATADAARILDASGKDVVLVETVGVGQAEVDVVRLADTVLVVSVPGLGDDIQNIKAGLMEIGDVFVVNKADREGVDKTVAELQSWLEMGMTEGWNPPVVRTVAQSGHGLAELVDAVARHREHLLQGDALEAKRRSQAAHEILDVVRDRATLAALRQHEAFQKLVAEVAARKLDPYAAADRLTGT